ANRRRKRCRAFHAGATLGPPPGLDMVLLKDLEFKPMPQEEGSLAMEPKIDALTKNMELLTKNMESLAAEALPETSLDETKDAVAPLPRLARAFRLLENDVNIADSYKFPEEIVDAIRLGLTQSHNYFEALDIAMELTPTSQVWDQPRTPVQLGRLEVALNDAMQKHENYYDALTRTITTE
ncbi:unnamed protein product, partial [Prorocentrum cordatum]